MNQFLCTFTAIVAVANAYSIGSNNYGSSGPVIGGLAYQQLPAVSLSLIPVHNSGYGAAPSAGYGAAPSAGYGAAPSAGYGTAPVAPLAYQVIPAPAPAPAPAHYGSISSHGAAVGGVDAEALQLAQLALQLPVPAGVLDGGLAPAAAASPYGVAPAPAPAHHAGYGSSAPAAAQSASAAAAASHINGVAPAPVVIGSHGGSVY